MDADERERFMDGMKRSAAFSAYHKGLTLVPR